MLPVFVHSSMTNGTVPIDLVLRQHAARFQVRPEMYRAEVTPKLTNRARTPIDFRFGSLVSAKERFELLFLLDDTLPQCGGTISHAFDDFFDATFLG